MSLYTAISFDQKNILTIFYETTIFILIFRLFLYLWGKRKFLLLLIQNLVEAAAHKTAKHYIKLNLQFIMLVSTGNVTAQIIQWHLTGRGKNDIYYLSLLFEV